MASSKIAYASSMPQMGNILRLYFAKEGAFLLLIDKRKTKAALFSIIIVHFLTIILIAKSMLTKRKLILIAGFLLGLGSFVMAQKGILSDQEMNWHHADPEEDGVRGVGTDRAYDFLKNKKARKVVVAIIDSGVDIEHEDLKDNIWTNKAEIPGNGIDDDNNGYIDDLHGWNFLGNSSGENLKYETLEITRLHTELAPRFKGKSAAQVAESEKSDFEFFQQVDQDFQQELTSVREQWEGLEQFLRNYQATQAILSKHFDKEDFDLEEVKTIESKEELVLAARDFYVEIYSEGFVESEFEKFVEQTVNRIKYHLNPQFNPRSIVGDDPLKMDGKPYGNPDVKGNRADHGTHVSGIVAALRGNGMGMDGVAAEVEIMALRAVPDGDERDKDIANAIRYAVDNGAQIINMSFGKDYSPQKEFVDAAVRHAESKGVLLIHGSGNDAANNDKVLNFPNPFFKDGGKATNWITVGANSQNADPDLAANFSNYGRKSVDVFAPGVDIYSTLPENEYEQMSGTSMASPVVTGVAALVWSYYPDLTCLELKEILLASTTRSKKWKTWIPREDPEAKAKKTKFTRLSSTGGIINAYQAVKMAESQKGS